MSDKININWGIIGAGHIAKKFATGLTFVKNAKLKAVASRDLNKAYIFASENQIEKSYGSYTELLANEEIDIVYIATPHVFHHENTLQCLNAGKAVLCEKPFAMNLAQAKEMVALAEEKELFLMEAFWTRFLPSFRKVEELIALGAIGSIKHISSDFAFKAPYLPQGRLFNKKLGGGSLLDVGVYPLFLCSYLLGKPKYIKAIASIGSTGVDETCSVSLQYNNGNQATLFSSIICQSATEATIIGDKGRIKLQGHWFRPTQIELTNEFEETSLIPVEYEGNGYNYEAAEATKCLINGKTQSQLWNIKDSLNLMELLDKVCEAANIKYEV